MRLIDADSIKWCKEIECVGFGDFVPVQKCYKEDVDRIPTINPESLRPHGKWILVPPTVPFETYKCNLCGGEIIYAWTKFCPHCGAKMEGADER